MRLKPEPLSISTENPLNTENFFKSRKDLILNLTTLVTQIDDGFTISLNGEWGTGKTTFLKRWMEELKNNKINTIYFDAFKNDYNDDPFVAISAQIYSFFKEIDKNNSNLLNNFKEKVSTIGKTVLGIGFKALLSSASMGIMNTNSVDAFSEECKKSLSESSSKLINNYFEERFKEYSGAQKSLEEMKDALKKLVEAEGKLVFIIDELDRCRPDYAVGIIEKIKHFFEVDGVVFVLSMNKKQMEEYVKGVYGNGVNAQTYLQKFINLECSLPIIKERYSNDQSAGDYDAFCSDYFNKIEVPSLKKKGNESGPASNNLNHGNQLMLSPFVCELAKHYNLSLRQIEDIARSILIYYAMTDKNGWGGRTCAIVSFLAFLKTYNPELFDQARNQRLNFDDIEKIGLIKKGENLDYDNPSFSAHPRFIINCILEHYLSDVVTENKLLADSSNLIQLYLPRNAKNKFPLHKICEKMELIQSSDF